MRRLGASATMLGALAALAAIVLWPEGRGGERDARASQAPPAEEARARPAGEASGDAVAPAAVTEGASATPAVERIACDARTGAPIDITEGYVPLPELAHATPRSPLARRVRVVTPLWPEARVRVRATDERGHLFEGPRSLSAFLGATLVSTGTEAECELAGIPDLRGQPLRIFASSGEKAGGRTLVRLAGDGRPLEVEVLLCDEGPEIQSDHEWEEWEMDGRIGLGYDPPRRLAVTLLRSDRTPAAGVEIHPLYESGDRCEMWITRTDAQGKAQVGFDPKSIRRVRAAAPGFLPVEAEIGERSELLLVEPPGWNCHLLVLDPSGAPAAYALIEIHGYALLEGDLQSIPLLTDRNGAVTLTHLPHGSVSLSATLGAFRANEVLTEGERSRRILLRDPETR